MDKFQSGERVIIYFRGKNYLVTLSEKGSFHTSRGYVDHSDIIGRKPGLPVELSTGHTAYVFRPSLKELVMKVKRETNIVYPKDAAMMIYYAGIGSGQTVLEAGSGSGALSTALAFYVKPDGKVISYDKRPEFSENARKNVEAAGLSEYVQFKTGDISESIEETDIDVVITDLPEPEPCINNIYQALKAGGTWIIYLPTISQIEKVVVKMKEHGGFAQIETLENLVRYYKVDENATRPEHVMTGHTGFLIFSRKIIV